MQAIARRQGDWGKSRRHVDAHRRRTIRIIRRRPTCRGPGGDWSGGSDDRRAAMSTREKRIQEIAYHLWEQEGRPDGHSERLWRAAEAQYEADLAKERYEAEIAKDRSVTETAKDRTAPEAKKPPRAETMEFAASSAAKPARASSKSAAAPVETPAEPPVGKKPRSAKAKAEQPKDKPPASVKRKPKAT